MTKTITSHYCDHCGQLVSSNSGIYFETWRGMDAAGSRDSDGPTLHLCESALRSIVKLLLETSRLTTSPTGIPRPFENEERAALAEWIVSKSPHVVDLRKRDA